MAGIRGLAIVSIVGLLAAACAPAGEPGSGAQPAERDAAGAREDVPSALDDMDDPASPEPLLDPAEIRSGGPPPDGIPPIDEPKFETASTIGWIAATAATRTPAATTSTAARSFSTATLTSGSLPKNA